MRPLNLHPDSLDNGNITETPSEHLLEEMGFLKSRGEGHGNKAFCLRFWLLRRWEKEGRCPSKHLNMWLEHPSQVVWLVVWFQPCDIFISSSVSGTHLWKRRKENSPKGQLDELESALFTWKICMKMTTLTVLYSPLTHHCSISVERPQLDHTKPRRIRDLYLSWTFVNSISLRKLYAKKYRSVKIFLCFLQKIDLANYKPLRREW